VKLVYGHYGDDVHRLLAEYNLAPQFHAVSEVEGAPKAYVVEYLGSLYPIIRHFPIVLHLLPLSDSRLIRFLTFFWRVARYMVTYGPPNIMINVSPAGNVILVDDKLGKGRANIKVVDFDWGGDAGKVFYPSFTKCRYCRVILARPAGRAHNEES